MKIGLNDIWEFLEYASKTKNQWKFSLKAGEVSIKNLKYKSLASLKNDKNFDKELINSLFVYREILWQPNVNSSAQSNLTPLKVFKAFCEDTASNEEIHPICRELLKGLVLHSKKAISKLSGRNGEGSAKDKTEEKVNQPIVNGHASVRVLGEFRRSCFPIIMFFIMHPLNREDYQKDAWNRLNYSVKVQLTQYNNKYTELSDPFWEISFNENAKSAPKVVQ